MTPSARAVTTTAPSFRAVATPAALIAAIVVSLVDHASMRFWRALPLASRVIAAKRRVSPIIIEVDGALTVTVLTVTVLTGEDSEDEPQAAQASAPMLRVICRSIKGDTEFGVVEERWLTIPTTDIL